LGTIIAIRSLRKQATPAEMYLTLSAIDAGNFMESDMPVEARVRPKWDDVATK
jgi:hypothetical protein